MFELGQTLSQAFNEMGMMTFWEAIAVVLAIAYLALAMKTNIWCWAAAFVSTAIYTVLFWKVSLLMESVLNIYYMAMAVYGYWMWMQQPKADNKHEVNDKGSVIISWSLTTHLFLIAVTSILSLAVGYLMANYTQASFPYLDAATTCFAVMTTYLVAKKVLENWFYWIIINTVSIYLYFSKGLMLTTVLFVAYVVMAIVGYFMWRKTWLQSESVVNASPQVSHTG
ncbi:nicotinamide riboside transporter PnuC [Shewanella aestuarii]|uniref:Nicotinamide riboside transporter PnuC n=1 Tax=Shewanella aestuarii TaxID=1028752 RepID=A0A6G9QQR6_9GAMM|nr:nicotinamide riboside transporter PnuC [Shewanella aestuarii]QIR16151.1 nicotinamide mononucleotide transporter [Shewanella aestuarii]